MQVKPAELLVLVAFILALPMLLPVAIGRYYLYKHRIHTAAKRSVCPSCGHASASMPFIGPTRYWQSYVAELHRANPSVKFRLVRLIHAICGGCGAGLYFREESGTFTMTKISPDEAIQRIRSAGR